MGLKYLQKTVQINRDGRKVKTAVIANRSTAALHLPATAYLINKSMKGLKIKSVEKYASIILSLIEEVEFDPEIDSLDDLNDSTMSAYLQKVLYEERGISGNSLNQHKQTLSNFFSLAFDMGYLKKPNRFTYRISDAAELAQAKSQGRERSLDPYRLSEKYIPAKQFNLLLSFEASKNPYVRARNEIILRLGYEVGLRSSEVTSFENLSVAAIKKSINDSEGKKLNELELGILGKGGNGGKPRTVVIPPALKRKIQRFIKANKKHLKTHLICNLNGKELGSCYSSTIFNRAKKNLIRKLDLEKDINHQSKANVERWIANTGWTFHALRHSFATNLAMEVISGNKKLPKVYVQERLGHEYARTTLIYCHFAAVLTENIIVQDQLSEEIENTLNRPIDRELVNV